MYDLHLSELAICSNLQQTKNIIWLKPRKPTKHATLSLENDIWSNDEAEKENVP
jgi:hypothetical protein